MGAPALQTSAADDPWAFQTDLVHQIEVALENHASVLLQLPTGGGKTHVAAAVIRRWNARRKRVWFVCHTRELIQQTCAKLAALGVVHGVVSPEYEPSYGRRVQVCSVDTLRSRIEKIGAALQDPDLIVWDECHHVAAPSWSAIKERYAAARHLGLTATPERLDGTGLGQWFDHLICGPTTRDLIVRGRLSRYRLFAPTIPDLRGVKTLAGDYAARDLDDRMGGSVLVGDVVEHYRKLAPGVRAIVFAVSVKHSKAVVERFQAAGIPAAHVDGTTRKDDRDAAVERLASGEIKVLSNVRVFTEGFDVPAIDAVIVLRPTKSRALFLQMIGRGLREAEGKSATIVLDHAGVVYEHGLPDDDYEWTLEGHADRKGGPKKALGSRLRRCPECNAVHGWAAECVECGHTYAPGERTIDEVYGDLREVWRATPDGYETPGAFARRIGRRRNLVTALIRRGLPVGEGGLVNASAALAWLEKNPAPEARAKARPGYETRFAFSRRIGRSPSLVCRLADRGLPVGEGNLVNISAALAWCEANPERLAQATHLPPAGSAPGEYESKRAFAERIGKDKAHVERLKSDGLPCAENGWVHVAPALAWLASDPERRSKKYPPRNTRPGEYERPRDFQHRIGCAESSLYRLCRMGLPRAENGWIPVEEGMRWYADHKAKAGPTSNKPPPGSIPGQYEPMIAFAKRIGVRTRHDVARLRQYGLPCAENGWIHVEKGLAWYEDYKTKKSK